MIRILTFVLVVIFGASSLWAAVPSDDTIVLAQKKKKSKIKKKSKGKKKSKKKKGKKKSNKKKQAAVKRDLRSPEEKELDDILKSWRDEREAERKALIEEYGYDPYEDEPQHEQQNPAEKALRKKGENK